MKRSFVGLVKVFLLLSDFQYFSNLLMHFDHVPLVCTTVYLRTIHNVGNGHLKLEFINYWGGADNIRNSIKNQAYISWILLIY